ncbi:MAG TPA: N-(5'-phosphoribosyl)anthranilate isomerase [Gammaproteobacteria bacterium]|jgi:phosphoribosylanthranilate isomerase|nr:phosphoribosylanthranilate isomerase [Arenicellales bacterium]MDP6919681.1 phosphoribosylanthranilate isomerase [Arenicellales bacterium]HCX88129.1 N-(5'-phosphoribosyl)anthranilate isomerase [Gammaproteobacteria bacterium]|tara:strand:- start:1468 stop:2112 length:645 start_codon:yes stop_codon:yes gene_type:complete
MASIDEVHLAARLGARAVGLVGDMPSGPGVIGAQAAAEIAREAPSGLDTFLLTGAVRAADIANELASCPASTVQIVRHIDPEEYPALIEAVPKVQRVQVIHIEDESALALAARYTPFVHAFLLDSGRTSGATPQFGGTGNTHDWSISARFVAQTELPVYLAGGLKSGNVFDAVTQVRPYGVDLCTGVRTNDQLDEAKLQTFMAEVRRAGAALNT